MDNSVITPIQEFLMTGLILFPISKGTSMVILMLLDTDEKMWRFIEYLAQSKGKSEQEVLNMAYKIAYDTSSDTLIRKAKTMHYIVLDFEWNCPLTEKNMITNPFPFDSEIIQIGAIKLDKDFHEVGEYKSYVSPTYYKYMNGDVVGLTKIRKQMIEDAPTFPEAFATFKEWCGEDCGLCSWGPDDIPVLMDNMIIHGIPVENFPCSFDLQRIFAREILREDRQCSLSEAVKLLQLPIDRAHDALNDARNTVRICDRMDLEGCIEEYETYYVDYEKDRLSGLISGKDYPTLDDALEDKTITTAMCPFCGEDVSLEFLANKKHGKLGYGNCSEGDGLFAKLQYSKNSNGMYKVKRLVYEMSTDFWDIYQNSLTDR